MAVARDQALSAYFRRPRLLRRLTRGHVNATWLVSHDDRRFVLQRINSVAFVDLGVVARNFAYASRQLRSRDVRTVRACITRAGEPWFFDDDGDLWRAYRYIDGRVANLRSTTAARDVAHAFGAFARALGELDATQFELAIPRFHEFDHRVRQFEVAVVNAHAGRGRACASDVDRVRDLVTKVRSLDEFSMWKRQPVRVVHNDAKPVNLVRHARDRPCVIDLDTIGPGRLGYDLGEMVRSIISEHDTGAPLDVVAIEHVWGGFVDGWRHPLDRAERASVPIAGVVLAVELACRYLASHLTGDRYFVDDGARPSRDRARVQMRRAALQLDALDDLRERSENLLSSRP
ncbi:MAG TPA: aminoglycoside phosphotransferase family protein [Acidimicrobiales bacterium]|nr:aminoglycoside phosphotransferase family protein [Acidimicrobiales bacterium]